MGEPYYQANGITLYHGDCRDILPAIGRFDLLLTDPPYGIGAANRADGGAVCSKASGSKDYGERSAWDSSTPPPDLIREIVKAAKHSIIWGGNYFALPPSMGWLVWDKGQRGFSLADAELAWTSRNKATRCFNYSRGKASHEEKLHPTQKPLAVMRWCLLQIPDVATVLDTFAGSGTTLVAAQERRLEAVGVEINERYCEAAAKRLEQESRQAAFFI